MQVDEVLTSDDADINAALAMASVIPGTKIDLAVVALPEGKYGVQVKSVVDVTALHERIWLQSSGGVGRCSGDLADTMLFDDYCNEQHFQAEPYPYDDPLGIKARGFKAGFTEQPVRLTLWQRIRGFFSR